MLKEFAISVVIASAIMVFGSECCCVGSQLISGSSSEEGDYSDALYEIFGLGGDENPSTAGVASTTGRATTEGGSTTAGKSNATTAGPATTTAKA